MMRGLLAVGAAVMPLAVAWGEHVEVRELRLSAAGLQRLDIDAGAGSLTVTGESGRADVLVEATISVPGDADDARREMASDMRLSLEQQGTAALLVGHFEQGFRWRGQPYIDLEVTVPANFALTIDDGSGSVTVAGVRGDVRVEDGSGSLTLRDSGGSMTIKDGSGAIEIEQAGGDVTIDDGSGSIDVRGVLGSITVEDGSGSIDVSDVGRDVIVVSDGSGGVRTTRVAGNVVRRDH